MQKVSKLGRPVQFHHTHSITRMHEHTHTLEFIQASIY